MSSELEQRVSTLSEDSGSGSESVNVPTVLFSGGNSSNPNTIQLVDNFKNYDAIEIEYSMWTGLEETSSIKVFPGKRSYVNVAANFVTVDYINGDDNGKLVNNSTRMTVKSLPFHIEGAVIQMVPTAVLSESHRYIEGLYNSSAGMFKLTGSNYITNYIYNRYNKPSDYSSEIYISTVVGYKNVF